METSTLSPNLTWMACRGASGTRLLLAAVLGLVCACGSASVAPKTRAATAAGAAVQAVATPNPAPAPAQTSSAVCSASRPASADWPAASAMAARATITASTSGDSLTLGFPQGTPTIEVRPQSSARFVRDPSGQQLALDSAAGAAITIRGFRGDTRNYSGPQSLTAGGPILRQVQEIGDFEGVVTFAAGLASPGCAAIAASGSTLTLRFIPLPSQPALTVADVEAVARQVFAGDYRMSCRTNDPACPITQRLAARVFAVPSPHAVGPGPYSPFCRCQNPGSRSMTVTGELTESGGVAHVTLYPDVRPTKLDLIMVSQSGKLLVDDMQCTGKGPSTSVYGEQLAPCGIA